MKLENCGRCGLEPVELEEAPIINGNGETVGSLRTYGCPVDDINETRGKTLRHWNAAQSAARTERVNAAAVAINAGAYANPFPDHPDPEKAVQFAGDLIDAQDAAARVRWAEMQKGE